VVTWAEQAFLPDSLVRLFFLGDAFRMGVPAMRPAQHSSRLACTDCWSAAPTFTASVPTAPRQASRAWLYGWWTLLLVLLVGEILTLSMRFDARSLTRAQGWWADLLLQAHRLPGLGLVILMASLLVGGRRWYILLEKLGGSSCPEKPAWMWTLGHLVAFGCLAVLSVYVFEGALAASPHPGAVALLWYGLALLTFALWLASALPPSSWCWLLWECKSWLLPGILIGTAAWAAGFLTIQQWDAFGSPTLWAVQGLLRWIYPEVICRMYEGTVGTSAFTVRISARCSGYEGIGLMLVFLASYLWMFRSELRFPHAFLLFPIATAVIWCANVLRITTLVIIGTQGAPAIALGGFHSQAGSLLFAGVALGLVVVTHQLPTFSIKSRSVVAANPVLPYLAPLLALVAGTMLTGTLLTTTADPLYCCRVVAVLAVLCYFRRELAGLCWSWSWTALGLGAVTFVMWLALDKVMSHNPISTDPWTDMGLSPGWTRAWIVVRLFGSTVTVPLAEELAFRGFLTRRLIAADFQDIPQGTFTWLSFVGSSVLFGALHGRWLAGTLAGMLFALALYRHRRVGDAVLAHACTNGLLGIYVITTGSWSLWD